MNLSTIEQQLKAGTLKPTGSQTSTFKCSRCKDEGFYYFTDDEGYEYSAVCPCQYKGISENILMHSGFPYEVFERMTFDKFETNTNEQKEMKELALKFVKEGGKWIGYFGASGAGKTHICIAIAQELVRNTRKTFKYVSYRQAIRQLRSRLFNEEKYSETMHDLVSADILYIDDLLKLSLDQKGDIIQDELRILYDIINDRYINQKITIFSSEYTMREIIEIDEALGSRIIELLGIYKLKCEGSNYRLGVKK